MNILHLSDTHGAQRSLGRLPEAAMMDEHYGMLLEPHLINLQVDIER